MHALCARTQHAAELYAVISQMLPLGQQAGAAAPRVQRARWASVQGVTQAPAVQTCPAAHAWPHEPQWAALVCVSTHAPGHTVCPLAQRTQAPETQARPEAQGAPQAPQFAASEASSDSHPLPAAWSQSP